MSTGQLYMRDYVILDPDRLPAIQHRAKFCFIDLIRPDCYHRYSMEQTFGIFGWMCQTAHDYTEKLPDQGFQTSGAIDLLNAQPTCVSGNYPVNPIVSLQDLQRRINYVLLSAFASGYAEKWKVRNGISVTATKILRFPHHRPFTGHPLSENDLKKRMSDLLASAGILRVQLNSCHADAKEIVAVKVHYSKFNNGFIFVLDYGIDGSVWHHNLAIQSPEEPFITTMQRAIKELASLRESKVQS